MLMIFTFCENVCVELPLKLSQPFSSMNSCYWNFKLKVKLRAASRKMRTNNTTQLMLKRFWGIYEWEKADSIWQQWYTRRHIVSSN